MLSYQYSITSHCDEASVMSLDLLGSSTMLTMNGTSLGVVRVDFFIGRCIHIYTFVNL